MRQIVLTVKEAKMIEHIILIARAENQRSNIKQIPLLFSEKELDEAYKAVTE